MGGRHGLKRWLYDSISEHSLASNQPAVADLSVIHAELRRARRFATPLAVITFVFSEEIESAQIHEIARELRVGLREFDQVVVNSDEGVIALWLSGTAREGALAKLARLQTSPQDAWWMIATRTGIAVFPHDGMTYDALLAGALAETSTIARPTVVTGDGSQAWQPNVHGANSRPTS